MDRPDLFQGSESAALQHVHIFHTVFSTLNPPGPRSPPRVRFASAASGLQLRWGSQPRYPVEEVAVLGDDDGPSLSGGLEDLVVAGIPVAQVARAVGRYTERLGQSGRELRIQPVWTFRHLRR